MINNKLMKKMPNQQVMNICNDNLIKQCSINDAIE